MIRTKYLLHRGQQLNCEWSMVFEELGAKNSGDNFDPECMNGERGVNDEDVVRYWSLRQVAIASDTVAWRLPLLSSLSPPGSTVASHAMMRW